MTCFFHLVGRTGNLLFIYAHARAYCEQNGYDLCLPPWIGEKIFDIPEAARPRKGSPADIVMPCDQLHQTQESLIYTRAQVRQWLQIKPHLKEIMAPVLQNRRAVMLDWRRGSDFLGAGLPSLSADCYLEAAQEYGFPDPLDYEWEVDTESTRLPYFQGDVNAAGEGCTWVSLPSFYRLITARVHFRAPSSYSWWAATLGDAQVFAPLIENVPRGVPGQSAHFVRGNYPRFANHPTDLHLKES